MNPSHRELPVQSLPEKPLQKIGRSLLRFFKNPLVAALLTGLAAYIILFFIYEPITQGLDVQDVTVLAVPTVLGLFLFQYFMGTSVLHRPFIAHGITGISWALTFPLLFHWSYTNPFYFYEFSNDFLFGLLLFMGLTAFQYLLTLPQRFTRAIAACFALLQSVLMIIPLGQIGYFLSVRHCITPASMMALYMTNKEESIGFLKNMIGYTGLVGLILFFIALTWFFYWCNRSMTTITDANTTRPLRLVVLITAVAAFLAYVPFFLFPQTCIIANWLGVKDYMIQLQQYKVKHDKNYQNLNLITDRTAASKVPGTVILVIGESASRNYMKAFNPAYPYDDTPWESKVRSNEDFLFFDHAYSSYVQTVPTLERALTERNQYEDKPFVDSNSILDVARKAGYHTAWLSNQGMYGEYDTAISLVAKTAEYTKWAHESYLFSDKYDESILTLLKDIDPNQNNFIVIHLMGSHIYYNDRYPSAFSKWKKGPLPEGQEAYANSIYYTDWVLEHIFDYANKNLHLQAMVYFSDHGESIETSHNPDNFNFDMTRIPFWIYLSPHYQEAYPSTYRILASREEQFFTNDLLYDLISGLLHAPSDHYDPARDFSSPAYRFNENNLTTMLGTRPLSQDPDLK